MFDALGGRLTRTLSALRGTGRLTEQNIRDALRDVRLALLEADVALPVVKDFTERARDRALGTEVAKSLTPGQAFVRIVHDELVQAMGDDGGGLKLDLPPPVVILLAGLQGAGKTTTAAKLARHLKERQGRKVLLTSVDVYRPAAREQLQRLAGDTGVAYFAGTGSEPEAIARAALAEARARLFDALIVDTAGRLHVDEDMMAEIRALHAALGPAETLFVVDAMSGQDAVNSAAAFGRALPLTGVVLTKADGDARGGAALSVRHVTGVPIRFLGVGEKTDALEAFDAGRLVSRILGMGDVVALAEQAQQQVDRDKAEALGRKLKQGKRFDLADYRDQLKQMLGLGGLGALLDKLPGGAGLAQKAQGQFGDRDLRRQIAIIDSMTPEERSRPDVLNGSRRRRIAAGSGTQVQDVNRLLKQHTQLAQFMKQAAGGGLGALMKGLKGRLPQGFGPR